MKDLWSLLRFLLTFAENGARARRILAAVVVAGVLGGLASSGLVALVNTALHQERRSGWLLAAFATLCLLLPAVRLLASWLAIQLAQDTVLNLRVYLGRRILATPLPQLELLGPGRLMSTMTEDVSALTGALTGIPTLCTQSAIVLGCLVYLGWLSPRLLLVVGAVILLGVASHHVLIRRAHRHFRDFRERWDRLFEHYRGLIHGAKELKLHARRREEFVLHHLQDTAAELRHHAIRGRLLVAGANNWGQALFFALIGVVVFVVPQTGIDVGEVTSGYVLTILYMLGPLSSAVGLLPTMSQAAVSAGKVAELGGSLADLSRQPPPAEMPDWSRLSFHDVSYTYRRQHRDDSFRVGPVTLEVQRGELVFIVGGNGSGKTTLAKMLLGLYEPDSGEIRLDGRTVEADGFEAYRQLFSVVFTDFYLFDSLFGFGSRDLDARAQQYLGRLRIAHKVEVKEGRLSTVDLSQGQRKRLALLVAYLDDRPIYLFDEWAADQEPHFRETFYFEILPELRARGKTVFVISHDDRYYHVADRILRLADGRIVYDGPAEGSSAVSAAPLSESVG